MQQTHAVFGELAHWSSKPFDYWCHTPTLYKHTNVYVDFVAEQMESRYIKHKS